MKKTFIFKVSSSERIGSGHIYRTLKIARQLKKNEVFFLTQNFKKNFNYLLKKYKYKVLKNSEKNFDVYKDLYDTINIIKKIKGKKILIIDNYINKYFWQKEVSKYVDKIVLINDLIKKNYCDLYINENFFLYKIHKKFFLKKNCQKLIGPKYSIILPKKLSNKKIKNNIFLFFGGSDKKKISYKVLKQLNLLKILRFNLILNDYKLINKIKRLKIKNLTIFEQNFNFYKIISKCSFGVIAGGSTVWDMFYNKLPFIAIPVAKNQLENLINLEKKKYIYIYIKEINKNFKEYFNRCINKKLKPNKLVDGHGIQRVSNKIQNL